jgi:hypothetical protein
MNVTDATVLVVISGRSIVMIYLGRASAMTLGGTTQPFEDPEVLKPQGFYQRIEAF